MLKISDFQEMFHVSGLLAQGLAGPIDPSIPPDVAEAIRAARKQMEDLPLVIEDLNLAFSRFMTLNQTLRRMSHLAMEAGSESESHPVPVREEMEEEFRNLAKVVADEAGQPTFQGTSLSILSKGSAKAASRVLSYLEPVQDSLDHELKGQKLLILEALAETINFLGIIALCYPEAKGVDELRRTLDKLQIPQTIEKPVTLAPTLH
jgi:hypothetical protein